MTRFFKKNFIAAEDGANYRRLGRLTAANSGALGLIIAPSAIKAVPP